MHVCIYYVWAPRVYPYPGYYATVSLTEVTEVPGKGIGILQNKRKLWVQQYGSVTEPTEVPGIELKHAYRTHISYTDDIPVPRGYLWHWRTELPELPGTGMNVVQNFQKFRV